MKTKIAAYTGDTFGTFQTVKAKQCSVILSLVIPIYGLYIIAIKKELRVAKSSFAAKALTLFEDFHDDFYNATLHTEIHGNSNNNILPKVYIDKKSFDRCYSNNKICK